GVAAAAIFSWSPLDVFFDRAFMPDASTIFLNWAGLWLFVEYCCRRNMHAHAQDGRKRAVAGGADGARAPTGGAGLSDRRLLALAAVVFGMGMAAKPPVAVTVLPALAMALVATFGWRLWRQ